MNSSAAADRGEPDDGSHYYHHWLAALERLVTSKGLLGRDALAARKEAWAEPYEHTPHGKPVELLGASVPRTAIDGRPLHIASFPCAASSGQYRRHSGYASRTDQAWRLASACGERCNIGA
jgi:hypothetical protein